MHLRTLELHGFKTFATPTRLEFAPRITAIVGPNGAGKSNIVDALRWVLGETAFQLLRARKTEDLIFAGAPGRARAGMAAVTLRIDNADAALPVDFSEVALTRRAYRDGRGEFLLNGQRVRLRDIKELLAQAGLSEGAHVFIGQGMVDAILALRPEDRRLLFEEAAGIGLVRQRREDALRRLDATRRNMERAQDLLAELEPRLRRLERQVRRGRDLEALQRDLRTHLRLWYGYRWQRAVAAVQQALAAHQQAQRAWDEARSHLEAVEHEQQDRFARIRALRQQRQDLVAHLRALQRQWQAADQARQQAEERLRDLERRQAAWQAEFTRAQETLSFRQEEQQAAQAQEAERRAAWEEARQRRDQAHQALEQALAARREVQRALDTARREVQRLTEQQAGLRAQHAALERRLAEVRQALEERAAHIRTLEAQAQAAAREQDQAHAAWEQARQAATQAKAAVEQAQSAAEQAAAAERAARQALDALRARQQRLQARLEGLRQAERELVGHDEAARFVVREVRQGVHGLLGPYLAVDEAHETAIAAALDLWAEVVLVDTDPEALTAAARRAPGRVLLWPRHPQGAAPPTPPARDGVLGRAADLVRVADDARTAAEALLGWVWVVRDAATARALRPHTPPGVALVTLTGEAYPPQGGVVVGRPKGRHVLQRTRERQALEAELAALTAELEALQARLAERQQATAQAQDALRQARAAWQQAEDARRAAHETWQQARLRHERLQQALDLHRQQHAEASRQSERLLAEQRTLAERRQALAQELEQAQHALRERRRELAALDVEQARRDAAYWDTQVAVARQAHREAQARVQALRQAVEQARQRVAALSRQAEAWQADAAQARQALTEAQERSRALWQRIEEAQRQLEPLEADLQALEAEHAAGQDALQRARAAAQRAEQREVQTRLALERARDRLQHLQRQIHDDFGPVALEAPAEVWPTQPLPLEKGVERLPAVAEIPADLEDTIRRLRGRIRRLGPPPGPELRQEYEALAQRVTFLQTQLHDLRQADADLRELIAELDTTMRRQFRRTFDAVNRAFAALFTRLFGGGKARLVLLNDEQGHPKGVDIEVRLPGKRTQRLAVLSGGERSLTAVALIFALLQVSPTPFCVLDEVDAMLDEANVVRFGELVQELSRETQFVIITHNRQTVQIADVLYGVTLREDGTSQVLSVHLDEVERHLRAHREEQP